MSGRYFSVSSVNTYIACPHQFWLQYVKRVQRPETDVPIPWRIGTAMHSALETAYRLRADDTGPVESMSKYEPQARETLESKWSELMLPRAHGKLDWAIDVLQRTLDSVVPPERRQDVIGVEHKIEGLTEDGVRVIGYVDLVQRASKDTIHIRDWKTTSSARKAEDLVMDFQLNTYAWFVLRDNPWAKRVVASHYYPPITKEVQFEVRQDCMEDAISRIEAVAEQVEMDTEFKPRPGSRCDSCAFTQMCPAWSSKSEAIDAAAGF